MRGAARSWFERVAKGQAAGPAAAAWCACLWPASCAYRGVLAARRLAYRAGLLKQRRVDAPVISVGNITVGGTGKTPFVAWLALHLLDRGRRPAIVSRGYRAGSDETNDEHRLLAEAAPGVPHVLDSRRPRGAATAVRDFAADCIILDDGFQHLALWRDLDIVLVDASLPFGNGAVLPCGVLREPAAQLRRADVIVLTRVDAVSADACVAVEAAVAKLAPATPIARCVHEPVGLEALGVEPAPALDWVRGKRVFWCCAIGHPDAFVATLERLGAEVAAGRAFPDHHRYAASDVAAVMAEAKAAGAQAVIVTQKDRVKLDAIDSWELPAFALDVAIKIVGNQAAIEDAISETLGDK